MKLFRALIVCLMLTFCSGQVLAQTTDASIKHFSNSGLSFDYPADLTMEDKSSTAGQHLVLTQGEHGAQIMIISRFDRIDSPEQLEKARREVAETFIEALLAEFKRQQAPAERITAKIDVAGLEAPGVRLRAVLSGVPGNAEAYSLQLGRRFVMVTLIGGDKELAVATAAWAMVRGSLKVE